MPDTTRSQQSKLRAEVRTGLRLHHYSIHTERSYVDWIVRFVRFPGLRSRANLCPAEPKSAAFLTDLAVHGDVAPATQNQAMNARVFLYQRVLSQALPGSLNAGRAAKKVTVPGVRTRTEVAAVLSLMDGTAQVVAKLLYGSGPRIREAVRLRVTDLEYQMKQLTVRAGKGDKDRFTTFPPRSRLCSRTTWPGSRLCISRTWLSGMARSTSLMRWRGNIPLPPRNGAGNMSFLPGISLLTPALPAPVAIRLTLASLTRPSRRRFAAPV
jgi:integrase